ncbi:hypothetical protein [Rhodovulum strictum]|uniref:Uncharacterized protein n=1 Tax=Rhodovulum strictum TaxID=58314 RepID=A0A844BI23_9RHOB|nr:hypothetical protein [Rhodovulum strictum]MRH20613.1 hypothetical protein [Rhodovulum strictum]
MTVSQVTGFLLAFLAGMMVYWLAVGMPASLTEEEGPIEVWSCSVLFIAAAASPLLIPPGQWLRYLYLPFSFFQLGAREFPGDLWIFDERVLTESFYRDQGLSLAAFVGAIYGAVALWSLFAALRWGVPCLWNGLRDGRRWAGFLALASGAVVVALGTEAVLKAGLAGADWRYGLHLLEEGAEAVFALALFLALYSAWRS